MQAIKTRFILFSSFVLIMFYTLSCKQLQEMAAFSKCEFRLNTIENIHLAGVDVQKVQSINDLSILDAGKLMAAVTQNNFPLKFNLNVDVKNPNTTKASLNRLDWILLIDEIEMLNGTSQKKIEVAPNSIANYPMSFDMNLRDILTQKTGNSLINFALNLADMGNKPTRLTLKAKPYVNIGQFQVPYPNYINIKTNFVSN